MKSLRAGLLGLATVALLVACQGGSLSSEARAIEAVKNADNAFSAQSIKGGLASAFREYALEQAVLLPDDHAALATRENIEQSLAELPASTHLSWSPQGADASGGLGYTWGIYTLTGLSSNGLSTVAYGKYLSVWKEQSGKWKLAAMMLNRSPGPAG